jgi:hypothetical protein
MSSRIDLAVIAYVLASAAAPRVRELRGSAPLTCLAADDTSAFYGDALARMVTDTDSLSQTIRVSLNLPQLEAGSVSLVTDSRTCSTAAALLA